MDVGHADHHYFLNFWGVGLITQVSENIETDKKKALGRLSYYLSAVQTVKEAQSFHIHLSSKERTYQGQAVMVLVGNGSFTGASKRFFQTVARKMDYLMY